MHTGELCRIGKGAPRVGLRINSTVPSLAPGRSAGSAAQRIADAQRRLSTGLRINRASDDAAGLAIAETFRTAVLQSNQEVRNLQSGVNLAQTAESGLESQGDAVGRIRELAVQAASGTLTDDQRAALNAEAQQLVQAIDATAQNTDFNGTAPLDGTQASVVIDPQSNLEIQFAESTASSLSLDTLDISTQAGATAALGTLDGAATQISTNRSQIGAQESGLVRAIEVREQASINQQEAESRIRDLDVAQEVINKTRDQILLQAGLGAIAQSSIPNQNALLLLGG